MEKKEKDYSKGKMYIIRNSVNDKVYVGSTIQPLSQRMAKHRCDGNKEKDTKIYQAMAELGIEKFHIELLENFPCKSIEELRQREGQLIRQYNSHKDGGYNQKLAGRTDKEYALQYYYANQEACIQKARDYKAKNPEKIIEKSLRRGNCPICNKELRMDSIARHRKLKNH